MVEANTTAVANKEVDPNNEVPHTQGSHVPAMKPNTCKVESKQVQVNSEVPHTEQTSPIQLLLNQMVNR